MGHILPGRTDADERATLFGQTELDGRSPDDFRRVGPLRASQLCTSSEARNSSRLSGRCRPRSHQAAAFSELLWTCRKRRIADKSTDWRTHEGLVAVTEDRSRAHPAFKKEGHLMDVAVSPTRKAARHCLTARSRRDLRTRKGVRLSSRRHDARTSVAFFAWARSCFRMWTKQYLAPQRWQV
jgi:hypothetical protein